MKSLLCLIGMLIVITIITMIVHSLFLQGFNFKTLLLILHGIIPILGGCLFIKLAKDLDKNGY